MENKLRHHEAKLEQQISEKQQSKKWMCILIWFLEYFSPFLLYFVRWFLEDTHTGDFSIFEDGTTWMYKKWIPRQRNRFSPG